MREILFRGKANRCPMNDEWVEGGFCPKDDEGDYPNIIKCNEPFEGYWFEIYPDTLGQYTGLKDKNGTKIFEGDVLRYAPDQRNCIRFDVVVADEWNCGCCNGVFGFSTKDGWIDLQKHEDCEVISNIHDNPDFLESEE